jgi:hypothetical protein
MYLLALSIMWKPSRIPSTWVATRLETLASRNRFRGLVEAIVVHRVPTGHDTDAEDASIRGSNHSVLSEACMSRKRKSW